MVPFIIPRWPFFLRNVPIVSGMMIFTGPIMAIAGLTIAIEALTIAIAGLTMAIIQDYTPVATRSCPAITG